jgi:dTDP-4-dehydrorhamnose reductase
MKILLSGTYGQVGSNVLNLGKDKHEIKFFDIDSFDYNNPEKLSESLHNLDFKPDIFINPAAFTAVDAAENEQDVCNNVNNISVQKIANYCKENNIFLVHYSTDYVFDGEGEKPFTEDMANRLKPQNFYGKTKLLGEQAIINSGVNYIIFRTSWVYNAIGKNFVQTMLKLMQEREELKIVADQIGSPTYATDIAKTTLKIIEKINLKNTKEIYNLCPSQQISWFDFANLIKQTAEENNIKLKIRNILPILSNEYPTPAKRPLNSRLDVSKLKNHFNIELPEIKTSLNDCIKKMFNL